MREALVLLSLCFSALAACAEPPPRTALGGGPVEVAVTVPEQPRETPSGTATAPAPTPPPEAPPAVEQLPAWWMKPILPEERFADAMKGAREAKASFERLAVPRGTPTDPATKAWFMRAVALVDDASHQYAAAFFAKDVTQVGRLDAIGEAAELDMQLAHRLDDLGLASMPEAWRSDPQIRVSFEDVAFGPLPRWRDESRVLAHRCVDVGKETGVATEIVQRCAAIRAGTPAKVVKRDAGTKSTTCGCSDGDPLCSGSIGGWCGH